MNIDIAYNQYVTMSEEKKKDSPLLNFEEVCLIL